MEVVQDGFLFRQKVKDFDNKKNIILLNQLMGNNSKNGDKSNQFKIQEWQVIKKGQYYNILQNKIDGTHVQQYTINFDQGLQYNKQIKLYQQRKQQLDNVIHLLDYINLGKQGFCSSHFNVKVYIQNIQIKLSQIRNLPEIKTILVIHQMLVGFKNLYVNYGPIDINPQMIGINQQSEIKVWINQDCSKNHPNTNPIKKNQTSNKESTMIAKILEISEKTTENKKFSNQFKSFLQDIQKPLTFRRMIQQIRNYANNRKTWKNNIQKKDQFRQIQKYKMTFSNTTKKNNEQNEYTPSSQNMLGIQSQKKKPKNKKTLEANQKNQYQLNPNKQIIKSSNNIFNLGNNNSQQVFLYQNQQQNKSFYSQKKLLPITKNDYFNSKEDKQYQLKQKQQREKNHRSSIFYHSNYNVKQQQNKLSPRQINFQNKNNKLNRVQVSKVIEDLKKPNKFTFNSVDNSPKNKNKTKNVPKIVFSVEKNELINQINLNNTISNQNLQQTSQIPKKTQLPLKKQEQIKIKTTENINKKPFNTKIQQIPNQKILNPYNINIQQIPNQTQQTFNTKIHQINIQTIHPLNTKKQQTHNQIQQTFNTKIQQIPNQNILQSYNINIQQIPNKTRQPFNTKIQQIHIQPLQPLNIKNQQTHNKIQQPFNNKIQQIHIQLQPPIHTKNQQTHNQIQQPFNNKIQQIHIQSLQPIHTKNQQTHNQIQKPFNTKNYQIPNQKKQSNEVPLPSQQYKKQQQQIHNQLQNISFNYMISHSNQLQKNLQKHNQPQHPYNINNSHISQQQKKQQFNQQNLKNNLITNPTYYQNHQIFNNMVIPNQYQQQKNKQITNQSQLSFINSNSQQQNKQQNYIQSQKSFTISGKSHPLYIQNQYQYQPFLDNQLFNKKNENNDQKNKQPYSINNQIMKNFNISNELKVQMRTSMINEQNQQFCQDSNYNFQKKMYINPIKENKNINQFKEVNQNYMTPYSQIKANVNINNQNTIRNQNNQHNRRSFSQRNLQNTIKQQSHRIQTQPNIINQISYLKHQNQNDQTRGNYKKKSTYQVIYNKPKPIQQYKISSINYQYYPSFINKQNKLKQNKSSLEQLFLSNDPSQSSNISYKDNQRKFDINKNLEKYQQLTPIDFNYPLNFLSQTFKQSIIPQQSSQSKKFQNNFNNNNLLLYPLSTSIQNNPLDKNLIFNYKNQFSTLGIYSKPYQFPQTLKFQYITSSLSNNKFKYDPLILEQIKLKNDVYDSSINQKINNININQKMPPYQTNDTNNKNPVTNQYFKWTFQRKIDNSLEKNTSQIRKEIDIPRLSFENNLKLQLDTKNLQEEHAYNIKKQQQFKFGQKSIDLTALNYPKQIPHTNAIPIDTPIYKNAFDEGIYMIKKQEITYEKHKKVNHIHFKKEQNNNETLLPNEIIHEQIEIDPTHQLSRMKNFQKCSLNYIHSENSFIENKQKTDNQINTEQKRKLAAQSSHKVFSQALLLFSQQIQSQLNIIRKRKFTQIDYLSNKSHMNDNYTQTQKNKNETKSKFSDNLYIRLQGVESEKYENYDNLWINEYYSNRSISNNMKQSQIVQEIIISDDFDSNFQINKLEKK